MATDNADELQAIQTAYKGRAGVPAAPEDAIEGKTGSASFSGNAALTAFTVTHNLGKTPTQVLTTGTSVVGAAVHAVTAKGATTFTVTYAAAPASGTNNVTFDWLAI